MAKAKTAPTALAGAAMNNLPLSPGVKKVLSEIQAELVTSYRDSFLEMVEVIRKQASQLARIQETLQIVVKHIDPKLAESTPAAMQIASPGSSPDLATTVVVSDPIGTGYFLSQADIAKALGISSARVSVLVRALGVAEDGDCAVQVRKGKGRELVNYHPRAIERMRHLIKTTAPETLEEKPRSALRRAKLELAP